MAAACRDHRGKETPPPGGDGAHIDFDQPRRLKRVNPSKGITWPAQKRPDLSNKQHPVAVPPIPTHLDAMLCDLRSWAVSSPRDDHGDPPRDFAAPWPLCLRDDDGGVLREPDGLRQRAVRATSKPGTDDACRRSRGVPASQRSYRACHGTISRLPATARGRHFPSLLGIVIPCALSVDAMRHVQPTRAHNLRWPTCPRTHWSRRPSKGVICQC